MSTRSESGLVRIRHRLPYTGKGFDMLGETVKAIGKAHPYAQKIGPLEAGKGYIQIEELVPEQEVEGRLPLSVHDAARKTRMEEFDLDPSKNGFQSLFEMFNILQEEGLFPGYVMVGNKANFQKWLGVRISVTKLFLFGIPVVMQEEIPDDVFLLCGTDQKDPEPDDIKFSLKATLP
jgi:hypothetical protein